MSTHVVGKPHMSHKKGGRHSKERKSIKINKDNRYLLEHPHLQPLLRYHYPFFSLQFCQFFVCIWAFLVRSIYWPFYYLKKKKSFLVSYKMFFLLVNIFILSTFCLVLVDLKNGVRKSNYRTWWCIRFGECYCIYWHDFKTWGLVDMVRLFTKNGKGEGTRDVGFKENEFPLEYHEFKELEWTKKSSMATLELYYLIMWCMTPFWSLYIYNFTIPSTEFSSDLMNMPMRSRIDLGEIDIIMSIQPF